MKLTLGGIEFPSKAAASQRARDILSSSPLYRTLDHPETLAFLHDLFALHPDWERKRGENNHYSVQVRRGALGDSRGFWLTRQDGSETDISYKKCLAPPNQRVVVMQAFRREIDAQISEFRRSHDGYRFIRCALSGALVDPMKPTTHVDHNPPFVALVEAFCLQAHLKLLGLELLHDDGVQGARLADRAIAKQWQQYHREWAGLRFTTREANIARGAG